MTHPGYKSPRPDKPSGRGLLCKEESGKQQNSNQAAGESVPVSAEAAPESVPAPST